MGIDPGLVHTGWGLVETQNRRSIYKDCGVISTTAAMPHVERLRTIGSGLAEMLATAAPDLIAVERVFISKNSNSSLLLGEARGAALMVLMGGGAPVLEISALQVKQSVTGMGRASKRQVADMVGRLLGISTVDFTADCTDALACALSAGSIHAVPLRRVLRRRRPRISGRQR